MCENASSDSFFVYIVRGSDDSFCVGHTSNVKERVVDHNEGRGAVWTACRRPVILVYQQPRSSVEDAVARERQIKGWTHAKKLALVCGDIAKLKALARRQNR